MSYLLGIDLGGTRIKCVACAPGGERLEMLEVPTDDLAEAPVSGPPPFAVRVARVMREIAGRHGEAAGVGLAAPGLADRDGRRIVSMPGRLHGIEGLDWSGWLGREVAVLNDAHAALLGEIWRGAARGLRDVVLLTLGTGVGGAIYADGRLLRGAIGRAGHLGHLCLDVDGAPGITRIPGSLEDAVGECCLKERSGGRFVTTRELVDAHLAGDVAATDLWLRSVRKLACGVASIINAVDPAVVLFGGGISKAGEALLEPLRGELEKIEWRPGGSAVEIRLAELGNWAGAYGAAWQGGGAT